MIKHLDLPAPHGFLVWQGKQTAIATDAPLEQKKYILTSNDEAFGVMQLSDPAQVKASEFHKAMWQDEHRLLPEERRLYFPQAETLLVYRIASFKRYDELLPVEDGEIVDADPPTDEELALIEQAKKLPKTIPLDKEAVTFDGKQYHCGATCEQLESILKANFNTEVTATDTPQPMALYQLALVRVPNIRLKKNLVKQEGNDMPWEKVNDHPDCPSDEPIGVVKEENGELEGCHANDAEANAQLAALNASESESMDMGHQGKEMSINAYVDSVMGQFHKTFAQDDEAYEVWVKDVFDSHIIASENNVLYRVNYMALTDSIVFAPRDQWVKVDVEYIDKAAKHLQSFDAPEAEAEETPPAPWLAKLKAAAKTIIEYCTWSEVEDKAQPIACPDLSAPCGVAVKDVDGEPWHFTWSTNAFEDREGEIFSTKALESYVAESWTREDKGTFDFWHIPGSDFASKQWQGIVGRFLVEAGPYMDNEAGQRAKAFFKQYPVSHPEIAPEGWGASPEFRFLPEDRADGVYDWLWITKTSTLPKAAAANIHTQGKLIMLSEDQREAAVKIFGESFVAGLEEQGKQKTEELEAAGVAHKSEGEAKPDEAADEQPAEETAPAEAEAASEEEAPAEDEGEATEEAAPVEAEAVAKQFEAIITPMTEVIKALGEELAEVKGRLATIETTEKVKRQTETPRWMDNLIRASQSVETEVKEDDELNKRKPKEAALPQGSTVSAFFSNQ